MEIARNSNMTQSSNNNTGGTGKPDDYDPDSNVYVANLPSDYGQIVRCKFVTTWLWICSICQSQRRTSCNKKYAFIIHFE